LTRKSDKLILKTCKNAIGVADANKKVTLFQVGKAKKSRFWVNIHNWQKVTFKIFRFPCVKTRKSRFKAQKCAEFREISK
jgi:hypothetical protein